MASLAAGVQQASSINWNGLPLSMLGEQQAGLVFNLGVCVQVRATIHDLDVLEILLRATLRGSRR